MFELDLLYVPDNADSAFSVRLAQADGTPFDLADGAWELRARKGAGALFVLTSAAGEIEAGADGLLTLRIPLARAAALEPGEHKLNLFWSVDGEKRLFARGTMAVQAGL